MLSPTRVHSISKEDVDFVSSKLKATIDDTKSCIRRHINMFVDEERCKQLCFFTQQVQSTLHLMLKYQMFEVEPLGGGYVQDVISRYEEYSDAIKELPDKLVHALVVCVDNCHSLCTFKSLRQITTHLEKHVYPGIDIKIK